jgi:hypothetical protein
VGEVNVDCPARGAEAATLGDAGRPGDFDLFAAHGGVHGASDGGRELLGGGVDGGAIQHFGYARRVKADISGHTGSFQPIETRSNVAVV